jgi:hypothetical protein
MSLRPSVSDSQPCIQRLARSQGPESVWTHQWSTWIGVFDSGIRIGVSSKNQYNNHVPASQSDEGNILYYEYYITKRNTARSRGTELGCEFETPCLIWTLENIRVSTSLIILWEHWWMRKAEMQCHLSGVSLAKITGDRQGWTILSRVVPGTQYTSSHISSICISFLENLPHSPTLNMA